MTAAALHLAAEARDLERLRVFHAAEHDWALAAGPPLSGRLALVSSYRRATGGGIERAPDETLTCAGLSVRLIPDTEHMRWLMDWEWRLSPDARGGWRHGRGDPDAWAWPEPESVGHVREAPCTADGRFTFPSVPAGRYLLLARITPSTHDAAIADHDLVLRAVQIQANQTLDILIRSDDWLNGPLLPE